MQKTRQEQQWADEVDDEGMRCSHRQQLGQRVPQLLDAESCRFWGLPTIGCTGRSAHIREDSLRRATTRRCMVLGANQAWDAADHLPGDQDSGDLQEAGRLP